MFRGFAIVVPILAGFASTAAAADFDADALHARFIDAFNSRQWDEVRSVLADDAVFHRANAEEVYVGSDEVLDHFEQTIGGEWNVKIAVLDSESAFTGKDGRVVERGDFAITAGPDDGSCYRGSYLMSWAPGAGDGWQIQQFAWQDVEIELENCQ